jgi:hypothetical protein
MATIIEFYIPKSFLGRPAGIPSQRCGKVPPFRAGHTENTNASSAFANATDYVRRRDRTDKTSSEGDHFQPPEISNCSS